MPTGRTLHLLACPLHGNGESPWLPWSANVSESPISLAPCSTILRIRRYLPVLSRLPGASGAGGASMPGVQARWDGRARWLDGSIAAEGGTLQPTSLAAYLDRACRLPGCHARRRKADLSLRCHLAEKCCSQFRERSGGLPWAFLAQAAAPAAAPSTTPRSPPLGVPRSPPQGVPQPPRGSGSRPERRYSRSGDSAGPSHISTKGITTLAHIRRRH
jgi:hypothetical protein